MNDKITYVDSLSGLYDVELDSIGYRFENHKLCLFGHTWIHASLWTGSNISPAYFCKRCKKVKCAHRLGDEQMYAIGKPDDFYVRQYHIGRCSRCNLRLLTHGCGVCRPNPRAAEIIHEIAAEMGIDMRRVGSGFHCELPVQVSRELQKSEEAARRYVRSVMQRREVPAHF